jgi:hypothetical protein
LQLHKDKWRFGLPAATSPLPFNTWAFSFTQEEKEALYLTNNDIPVKSSEMTAPRLVFGAARELQVTKKIALLAEANFDFTFDGKRNTIISANPVSIDPKLGLECNINNVFYLRGGINNFQRALKDGIPPTRKKFGSTSLLPVRFSHSERKDRLCVYQLSQSVQSAVYPCFFITARPGK